MKFAPMKDLLTLAERDNIALGAYVTVSYEMALAIVEAGSETNTPVIFITGTDCVDLMGGFDSTVETIKRAGKNSLVPIALHLDHSNSFEDCAKAINAGYSSVMIDGSSLPLSENIALTKKVVDFAHPLGITVEGELGRLIGEEGNLIVKGPEAAQTDPEEALEFVRQTNIDCLAVCIGTQHGQYKATPHLNIERLKKINDIVDVPLVLHGGSGTPVNQIQDSISNGIRKINVATDLLIAYADSFGELKNKPDFKYNTGMFINSKNKVKELVTLKMQQFKFES